MIIDYRIYATAYALLMLAWAGAFIPLHKAKPGHPTFRLWMNRTGLWMGLVAAAAGLIGFVNFVDWLWA
jgi:hypothetical protein